LEQFEVPMGPIDTPRALKSLKVRFESSTAVLTKAATFEVPVRPTALAVED